MRRGKTIISQTEQIHQAIHYGFGGLVLFDDNENQQTTTTTNNRPTFYSDWLRHPGMKGKIKSNNYFYLFLFFKNVKIILMRISYDKDHSISVLILSYDDVQRIFGSLQPDSNQWLSCPDQWHNKPTTLKLGGTLSSSKIQLTVNVEETKIELPVVMSSIRGTIDPERFMS